MTIEQVPVLVSRDRSGATRSRLLADRSIECFDQALGPILPKDSILCSDGAPSIAAVATKHGIRHEPVNLSNGARIRDKLWHIQNANAHHSRLKAWIARRKGVATKYLPKYLAWHHMLEKNKPDANPQVWITTAINS